MSNLELSLRHFPADVFGLSSVARSALAARPNPAGLPELLVGSSPATLPEPPDRLDGEERVLLSGRLEAELTALQPPVAVLDAVRSLVRPGACMVVTGQQPGFLGGPLFLAWKALHTIRLARTLAATWHTPVVPVFWNHGDDHDLSESNHIHLLNDHLDPTRIGLSGAGSGRRPLSEVRYDAERHGLGPIEAHLHQLLPPTPHRERALAACLPREGESIARAYSRTLTEVFGRFGLVVLEPDWIRDDLSRALAQVVGANPRVPIEEGAEQVRAAGYAVALDPESAALLFRVAEDGRRALRLGGDGFRYDGEPGSRTPSELAAEIVDDPRGWSAGALLRPIVQDMVLPVAAYVGGWGEWAYLAQLGPLRRSLDLPAVPFVPRLSATLVNGVTRASLARVGIDPEAVLRNRGRPVDETGGDEPHPVVGQLRGVAERASRELLELRGVLAQVDRGLAVQLKRTARVVRDEIERLCARAERSDRNTKGGDRRHWRRVANTLCPRGRPQERVLGLVGALSRWGFDWLEQLVDEVDPFASEHLLVELEEGDAP